MLFDGNNVRAAISALKSHYSISSDVGGNIPPLVCDPVCVSTSGHTLLNPSAIDVIIEELFPLAVLVTPNKAEAELILSHRQSSAATSRSIESLEDMLLAAEDLLCLGPKAVLLKGGHLTVSAEDVSRVASSYPNLEIVRDGIILNGENMEILKVNSSLAGAQLVVDVLHEILANGQKQTTILCRPRIESTNTHGTGCTLSAAIAAELALSSTRECIFSAHQLHLDLLSTCSHKCCPTRSPIYLPRYSNRKFCYWARSWATQSFSFDDGTRCAQVSIHRFTVINGVITFPSSELLPQTLTL